MYESKMKPLWPGWETVRLIGRGSFGTVYEIQREVFGDVERAALKHISIPQSDSEIDSLRGEGLDDESITETVKDQARDIVNEYKLMKKLNDCPNVVSCDDVAFVQQDDGYGWDIFIKMELLTPLLKRLGDGRDTPEAQVIALGKDMCRALCECRKYNIIHRDIKPQNIFASDAGLYKLGDFGIARTKTMTSTGTAKIGTYDYMAPEVFHAQRYGAGADLYSLGMVLYWLLNRRRCSFQPVEKQRLTLEDKETARKRRMDGEEIPAPAHGSEELKRIVLKACAFDPKDRYQSAEEMLRDLEALSGKGATPVLDAPVKNSATSKTEPDATLGRSMAEKNRITTNPNTMEEDDGAKTVGMFGKREDEAEEDDDTVRGAKTNGNNENAENAATKADEKTVGAFGQKEKRETTQPAPSSEPKPKRTFWPIFVGIAATATLLIVLVLKMYTADNINMMRKAQIGSYVTFGSYEQDNNTSNGKEAIEWLVLAKENDRILVISRYALDCRKYDANDNSTWESSFLREWLNGFFMSAAFSAEEQAMIPTVTVSADENPTYSTEPGNSTKDQVFLLSITEAKHYFGSNSARQCEGTAYCYAHGAFRASAGFCWWWLRSPGWNSGLAAYVFSDGSVLSAGHYVDYYSGAVRPALWIKLAA